MFIESKEETWILSKCGVNKLDCEQCNAVSKDQTQRNFESTFKNNLNAFRNKHRERSDLAKHLLQNSHPTYITKIKPIYICENTYQLTYTYKYEFKNT